MNNLWFSLFIESNNISSSIIKIGQWLHDQTLEKKDITCKRGLHSKDNKTKIWPYTYGTHEKLTNDGHLQ
jgi:hypothetical protein